MLKKGPYGPGNLPPYLKGGKNLNFPNFFNHTLRPGGYWGNYFLRSFKFNLGRGTKRGRKRSGYRLGRQGRPYLKQDCHTFLFKQVGQQLLGEEQGHWGGYFFTGDIEGSQNFMGYGS